VPTGRVTTFDERAGVGTVVSDDGQELFFHCTAIADGTRSIAVGTPVSYEVVAGRRGRWEAVSILPAGAPTPAPRRGGD
jgi:CspA family cold shock protein